nr:hypothetical protein [Tanacetum cinerariifolium]
MTTLANKAILSGAENRPPMLEQDMYDSWKSRMELYMMNRQHGRMILESIENGPLLWLTVEQNGETNIILQGLPPKVYTLVSNHKVAKEVWERIQLLMQGTSLTKQERELNTKFLNTLPPEWSKFVTDVKLVRDLQTTNVDQLHAYLGQHEFHANEKGDDPIDAINHMMSFLTAVVTSRRQNSLAGDMSSQYTSRPSVNNLGKQRIVVCYNYKGEGHMSKQCTKPKRKRDEAWFKDKNSNFPAQQDALILSVIEQLKTQVINCTKINQENKSINETLIAELERYKDQVRILKEENNVDKVSDSCAQFMEIDNLKQTLLENLKEKESLIQTVTLLKNDFQKEESRNIDRELALEKQLEPKLYNGCVIQKTNAIVICDSEETLMLEEESQPNLSTRPTQVEIPKELPKVSMVNSSLKKLKFHLASFDVVVKEGTTATAITEGTWGFEHTKACFRDKIIPLLRALKDLFNLFDQFLIDELSKVQNVFNQIEHAVEQHRVETNIFQDKMKEDLNK